MRRLVHYHAALGYTPCGQHTNPNQTTDRNAVTCPTCAAYANDPEEIKRRAIAETRTSEREK